MITAALCCWQHRPGWRFAHRFLLLILLLFVYLSYSPSPSFPRLFSPPPPLPSPPSSSSSIPYFPTPTPPSPSSSLRTAFQNTNPIEGGGRGGGTILVRLFKTYNYVTAPCPQHLTGYTKKKTNKQTPTHTSPHPETHTSPHPEKRPSPPPLPPTPLPLTHQHEGLEGGPVLASKQDPEDAGHPGQQQGQQKTQQQSGRGQPLTELADTLRAAARSQHGHQVRGHRVLWYKGGQ